MKRFPVIAVLVFLFLGSCQNKDIDMAKFEIVEERVRPSTDTVGIEGTYDFAREARSMKIHMGQDSTLSDASSHAVTLLGKDYSVTVRGLQPGTTYYYRYSADFGMHSDLVSETRHFVTSEQQSYRISVSSDPGWGGEVTGGGTYEEGQTCTVSATPSEGYVFAFWKESEIPVTQEPSYTFEVTESRILVARFAEIAALPVVITGEVSEIGGVSAMGSGEVTGEGGSEVTERGVCWATGHVPTTSDSHAGNGSGTGAFMAEMTGLSLGTTYRVRAYAVNSEGTAYGEEKSFTTLDHQEYTVSVSASPSSGGTVEGGGSYEEGASCTVRATANNGYTFSNWTEDGNPVSTQANYTFTVTSNRNLVANFTQQITVPTVTTTPVTNITETSTTGGGDVTSDGGATVTARGVCWGTSHNPTTSGSHVTSGSGLGSYTCLMTNLTPNTTYYVRAYATNSQGTAYGNEVSFVTTQLPMYTINVSPNPTSGGNVSGGGSYQQGRNCTVTATANNGYDFVNWTENGNQVSTNASYTFTVTANRNLVANFTQQVTLPTVTTSQVTNITETAATSGGNVTSDGGATVTARGICWGTSHDPTTSGSHVTSGSGVGSYTCLMTNLTPNTTYFVRAYATNSQGTAYGNEVSFTTAQLPTYTINVSASPTVGGSVSGGGTYQQGQSCTVTATANNGYDFVNWTENGSPVSLSDNYTFTVTGNRTLVAHFEQQAPQNYTITVSANPADGGTVSGGGTYQQGQFCTVTAEANRFSSFYVDFDDSQMPAGWTTIDNGSPPGCGWQIGSTKLGSTGNGHNGSTDLILSESYDNNYGVVYPDNYLISPAVTLGNGSIFSFWACAQDASYSAEHFGVAISTTGTNASDFTMINEWTMTAKGFNGPKSGYRGNRAQGTWYQYTVDLSAYTGEGRYIAIRHFNCMDQFYLDVDDIELTGVNGYNFVNWTENGNIVSTDASYTFTVNSNRNLVANFTQQTPQSYYINVSANPSNGGSVSGGGTYQQRQSCTVHAMENSGYNFVNWTENGNVVSTNANYTFTVNGNRSLVANFTVATQPGWHTYCESEFNNAVGSTVAGGISRWAYEYPISLTSQYAGFTLTKVSMFSDTEFGAVGGYYTCTIYVGGNEPMAGTAVSTISVEVPQNMNDWVDFDLTSPVPISGSEVIWVVWTADSTYSSWPAGCCEGLVAEGTWWNTGLEVGYTWEHQTYGTWTMRQYFTNRNGRGFYSYPQNTHNRQDVSRSTVTKKNTVRGGKKNVTGGTTSCASSSRKY